MRLIQIHENGIFMTFAVTDSERLRLLHCSALPCSERDLAGLNPEEFAPVEAEVTGDIKPESRLGNQMVHTAPGYRLRYRSCTDTVNAAGRKLEFHTADEKTSLEVTLHYQFFNGIPAVRCWTEVHNAGTETQGLECVTSFSLHGFERGGLLPFDKKMRLGLFHNGWQKELAWEEYTFPQLGLSRSQQAGRDHGSKIISASNTGNWSTQEYIPMGLIENQETGEELCFQIEHNGSWHWEIGELEGMLYLKACGPTQLYAQWWHGLAPGETFTSVPAGVAVAAGSRDKVLDAITEYRRAIRRPNRDDERMPVIFNDYMNCLYGDPTTEKELPLIDAAAEAGCEYYCIDCGWYSDGRWWDSVGEWKPSAARFPGGLGEVTDYIRKKGMIPGLWLELEVMGLNCPLTAKVPDSWFFQRHGKKISDKHRYQLDFRNPEVTAFADGVVDRLIRDFGIGYIKMDYNIEPGTGTDRDAGSAGDGLLGHNRAYLAWLDGVFQRHPGLVIENCSSGGMRMDYAMLSRYSIQSTSDTEDYRMYSTIAANAPGALTPEQAAIWSYPLEHGSREETIFNMVNALLLRIHQSGRLDQIDSDRRQLVKEAISYYKATREDRKDGLPFWPLGLSHYRDPWAALGICGRQKTYLAVWRRESPEPTILLPLKRWTGQNLSVRCAYPSDGGGCELLWNSRSGMLSVTLPGPMTARILEIEPASPNQPENA